MIYLVVHKSSLLVIGVLSSYEIYELLLIVIQAGVMGVWLNILLFSCMKSIH